MKTDWDRQIVHMDLDSFFVSVERLMDSRLQGRPILIGGTGERGVVSACSYETRAFGVHSAMPMRMARRLCPEAIVLRGDFDRYTDYSRQVTELISESVPVYEKASIDEFYLDLSGMERFFGCYSLATDLRQRVQREIGLPISFGLSSNKTVAKVATGQAKPNGQLRIEQGAEKGFLSPLPVGRIPMVGEKTAFRLHSMGVRRIGTLQQMPVRILESAMGKSGRTLWEKANGIDPTPVEPYTEQKSLSTEETFAQDTADFLFLRRRLLAMTETLASQLRQMNRLSACITIKIRYANFDTHTRQAHIAYTATDTVLINKASELFELLYERRLMVRLLGIRFSHLVGGNPQIDLFEDTEQQVRLCQAIDHLNHRFGPGTVVRAFGTPGRSR